VAKNYLEIATFKKVLTRDETLIIYVFLLLVALKPPCTIRKTRQTIKTKADAEDQKVIAWVGIFTRPS